MDWKRDKPASLTKKLSRLLVLIFVILCILSNLIIQVSSYRSYRSMLAEKLEQTVVRASMSHARSLFDTLKREALILAAEEPMKAFLNGSGNAEDLREFLRIRTDVSVSQYLEVYSAARNETVYYREPGDLFGAFHGRRPLVFGEGDCTFLPVETPNNPEDPKGVDSQVETGVAGQSEDPGGPVTEYNGEAAAKEAMVRANNISSSYVIAWQRLSEDGSFIGSGLSAHVTRNGVLSGLILPQKTDYNEIWEGAVKDTDSNLFLVNPDDLILSDYYFKYAGQSLDQFRFYKDFDKTVFAADENSEKEIAPVNLDRWTYLLSVSYQPRPGLYVVGVIQTRDIVAALLPTSLLLFFLILSLLGGCCVLCIRMVRQFFLPYEKLVLDLAILSTSKLEGADLLKMEIEKGIEAKQKVHEVAIRDLLMERDPDEAVLAEMEQFYPGNFFRSSALSEILKTRDQGPFGSVAISCAIAWRRTER